jgi:hypothetical protein
MKGFTKRFLTFMIEVSVVSQSGIGVLAAGGSQPGLVSDPGSGAAKGTRAVPAEDTIIVDKEMEITADDSHNYKVVDGGYLSIYSLDDETEITVSGNIEICNNGMVDIWELVNVTGTITVHAGGQLGIGGTVEDVVPEQDAFIVLGENGVITNMPEGYELVKDEYDNLILVPAQDPGADYAAGIEGTENYYNTLEEALNAAGAGQTVVLMRNVTVDESILVKADVTLDLKGYDLLVGDTLSVTGNLIDSGENRGHFAAGTYFFSKNTGSAFPVYDSENGVYSLYELGVSTYNDTQTGTAGTYGFRLTKGSERDAATELINSDAKAGLVEARVLICWKETEGGKEKNIVKTIAYDSSYLLEHTANPSRVILTFRMTGLDTVSGSVTATPVFVAKDGKGIVIAEIKGNTLTVKE